MALLATSLALLVLAAPPQARDLPALFRAADADPAQIVPLIVEASRTIPTLPADRAALLADTLEPYARRAFFGPERWPGMERLGLRVHEVARGENPTRIAKRYGTPPGLLRYLNEGYDERRLRVGAELKVLDLTGGLRIAIEKSRYRLSAWSDRPQGPLLLLQVQVGLGAPESPTPVGRTRIAQRVLDPEWTHPVTRVVYPPGDPGNVLGGYWIALEAEGIGKSGIGLHGFTGDVPERWIERPASNGCVRLLQPDIDRVFHLALEGTPVEIR